MQFVLVGIGGALGSIARYAMVLAFTELAPSTFPLGTVIVNILGSALIGGLAGLASTRHAMSPELATFLMVGVCGGYTTFSSFSLQTFDLLRSGRPIQAIANVTVSVVFCLVATTLAYRLVVGKFS
ncbi:MAG TPA: fluoride efflux transporter CrcB [Acidisphaera sp.]|nr:fluoride efflux transporter CrcB [Acidisphaera sp.]